MTANGTEAPAFEAWALIELMGHRQLIGFVHEVEMFGGQAVRASISLRKAEMSPSITAALRTIASGPAARKSLAMAPSATAICAPCGRSITARHSLRRNFRARRRNPKMQRCRSRERRYGRRADFVHRPGTVSIGIAASASSQRPAARGNARARESRRSFCRRPAGGFSLGLIQAGIEVVAAVEWDFAAALTYMTNLCRYGRQVQNAQAKTKPPDKSSAAQLELFLETAA